MPSYRFSRGSLDDFLRRVHETDLQPEVEEVYGLYDRNETLDELLAEGFELDTDDSYVQELTQEFSKFRMNGSRGHSGTVYYFREYDGPYGRVYATSSVAGNRAVLVQMPKSRRYPHGYTVIIQEYLGEYRDRGARYSTHQWSTFRSIPVHDENDGYDLCRRFYAAWRAEREYEQSGWDREALWDPAWMANRF